jgi:hypothetical protein
MWDSRWIVFALGAPCVWGADGSGPGRFEKAQFIMDAEGDASNYDGTRKYPKPALFSSWERVAWLFILSAAAWLLVGAISSYFKVVHRNRRWTWSDVCFRIFIDRIPIFVQNIMRDTGIVGYMQNGFVYVLPKSVCACICV